MTGPGTVLVGVSSATHSRPGEVAAHHIQAINRSHSDMVKFSSRHDKYYRQVLHQLLNFLEDAPDVIAARFAPAKGTILSPPVAYFGSSK